MGLDGVELVMEVEDEFEIAITNEEAEKCETPGQLTDMVFSKLQKSINETCSSQHGFYKVRKTLIEKLNIPRNSIKPETNLDSIIPKKGRKRQWKKVLEILSQGQTVNAPLERPKWLKIIISILPIIIFIISFINENISIELSVVYAVIGLFLSMVLTSFMKYEFTSKYKKVKDLIRIPATLNSKIWKREKVFENVQEITVKILGIDISLVTETHTMLWTLVLANIR